MIRLAFMLVLAVLIGCASTSGNNPPKVELRGRILDPEGHGVAGVRVDIDPTNDREWRSWGWITRHDGSYRAWVVPGRYHINLASLYQRVWDVDLDTIDVPLGGAKLDYQYSGFKIWGHVEGHDGHPPKGTVEVFGDGDSRAFVHVADKLARGRYLVFVPRGRYEMEWGLRPPFPTFGSRGSFPVSADTMINLRAPWEEVRGQIRIREIETAWNAVAHGILATGDTMDISGQIRTDSRGRYFAYLPSGSYRVYVAGNPTMRWIFPRTFSRSVPGSDPIDTHLPAVSWKGTVSDSAAGTPLDSVIISVSDNKNYGGATTVTDRKGGFRLLLEAGRVYTLDCWDSYRHRGRLRYRLSNVTASGDTVFNVPIATSP